MSLADKLEYLIGTKTAIRDALNESGARIDESLPFRQYAGWIEWLNYSRANELRSLFANGETGTLATDLPYFVDVDGNTPATWGDPVGLIRDASPNRADFTQPTVTARPILGRVPRGGRRNILRNTELRGSFWVYAGGLTRQAGVAETPDGYRADRITLNDSQGRYIDVLLQEPLALGEYAVSIWVYFETLPESYPFQLAYHDGLSPIGGAGAYPEPTIGPEYLNKWTELSVTFDVTTTDVNSPRIRFNGFGRGEEGTVYLIGKPQLEQGDSVTPYQAVTSEYNITESGVPDVYYLNFDGTDDLISTELPAIENGTLVIAGTNGIWIDDDYNFAGGTFSIGTTSYTNGPEGILTAVGDPVVGGFLVINRQLSQQERERVIQELKERGAPGVFELGPELYPEGRFEDGIDNIGSLIRGTAEWSDGALKLVTTEVAQGQYGVAAATRNLSSLQSDGPRFVEVAYTSETANTAQGIRVNRSASPFSSVIQSGSFAAGSGRSYMLVPAGASIPYLHLRSEQGSATVGDTFLVQLISVRKLELIP